MDEHPADVRKCLWRCIKWDPHKIRNRFGYWRGIIPFHLTFPALSRGGFFVMCQDSYDILYIPESKQEPVNLVIPSSPFHRRLSRRFQMLKIIRLAFQHHVPALAKENQYTRLLKLAGEFWFKGITGGRAKVNNGYFYEMACTFLTPELMALCPTRLLGHKSDQGTPYTNETELCFLLEW